MGYIISRLAQLWRPPACQSLVYLRCCAVLSQTVTSIMEVTSNVHSSFLGFHAIHHSVPQHKVSAPLSKVSHFVSLWYPFLLFTTYPSFDRAHALEHAFIVIFPSKYLSSPSTSTVHLAFFRLHWTPTSQLSIHISFIVLPKFVHLAEMCNHVWHRAISTRHLVILVTRIFSTFFGHLFFPFIHSLVYSILINSLNLSLNVWIRPHTCMYNAHK